MSIESGNFEEQPEEIDLKKEAEKLGEKHAQKTWTEIYWAAYQTRESKTHGKKVKQEGGTEVWGGKEERGASVRYERGQIFKAYKILRQEIQDAKEGSEDQAKKKGLLKELRLKAKEMERDLDNLEEQ